MIPRHVIALLALLLGGCGDDPDNVPEYGQWELVRTLDSVTIDGMVLAPEGVAEFRQFEGTEQHCGEPIYTRAEWQADDVSDRTGGQCELTDYSHDTRGARLVGRCTIEGEGVEYTPTLTGRSTFDATSTRDVVTMEGTLTVPGDSSPHVMKAIAVQEGRRIDDC
ncbi:DUF3617 domain-containing protein [Aurantiacibacter luteus]|uniref:DUF3617 domain-containing protein n=1 Tax=Aurantiacibacter luteus TaxID=1581420 RepID=A0A0G9MWA7_9SPHN|nr:DUF3617 family protein [Aurantiacibacter luteus]KLE34995.1 hypothetical protein AAW00_00360 [Aurantiacibacter luteus]